MRQPPRPTPSAASGSLAYEMMHPDVYAELRRLAEAKMAGRSEDPTLQPTMLVHEAWLRLSLNREGWRDKNHFFAVAATAMRHILIDHARRKSRLRHGGDLLRAATRTIGQLAAPDQDDKVLLIDEAISALEQVHPERARVVVARFFGGLTTKEIAESLGLGERSVDRHWAAAKVWLLRWIDSAGGR